MACGIAGLSVAADLLSAIKYARVKPVRDHHGLAVDFVIEGDYPQYGNNDDRVDAIACDLVERFMRKIQVPPPGVRRCRTQSILTHHLRTWYTARKPATPRTDVGGDAVRPGGQSDAWPRPERGGGVADLGGETAVYPRQRWHPHTFSILPAALGKAPSAQETTWWACWTASSHHEETVEGDSISTSMC